jgi:hypothetical protein
MGEGKHKLWCFCISTMKTKPSSDSFVRRKRRRGWVGGWVGGWVEKHKEKKTGTFATHLFCHR